MLYNGWLGDIAKKFQYEFDRIEVTYNFDYGPEFEIAVATVLRKLLPQRYGVCRGFVVGQDGQEAGDDIIVYDAQRFPVIRALENDSLALKERVPADAVLAYVEAKHTLHIEAEAEKGTSLAKALQQVARVKNIPRGPLPLEKRVDGWDLTGIDLSQPGYPPICNPYYAVIWARHVKSSADKPIVDVLTEALRGARTDTGRLPPDAIFAGTAVAVPVMPTSEAGSSVFPFLCEGTNLATLPPVADSWGIAMVHLLWAIEWIRLDELPWSKMIGERVRGLQGRRV